MMIFRVLEVERAPKMLSLGTKPNRKIALSFGRHFSGNFKPPFALKSFDTPSEILISTTLTVRSVSR